MVLGSRIVHVLRPFFLIWRSPPAVILDDKNQHMRFCQGLKDLLRQGTPGSHRLAHANLMRNGKKQIYGSQIVRGEDGEWKLYPVQDPETINERRAAMGLRPIEEYLANWDLEFDPATASGD